MSSGMTSSIGQSTFNTNFWGTPSLNTSLWSQSGNNVLTSFGDNNVPWQTSFNTNSWVIPSQNLYLGNQFDNGLWTGFSFAPQISNVFRIIPQSGFSYTSQTSVNLEANTEQGQWMTGQGGWTTGQMWDPAADGIVSLSPPFAEQGDMDLMVTFTLNDQMMMLSSGYNLLSVKIGSIEGVDINSNGLEITAVFDIPDNEAAGMKDVSIEFEPLSGGFMDPGMFTGMAPGMFTGMIQPSMGGALPAEEIPPEGVQPIEGIQLPGGSIPQGDIQSPQNYIPGGAGMQFTKGGNFILIKSEAFEILVRLR